MVSFNLRQCLIGAKIVILFQLFGLINAFDGIEFEPYRPSDSYKCGQFIESSINDVVMRHFHQLNNQFIRLLSKPFPHEQLLSRAALQGNISEVQNSLNNNYTLWVDFEKYWITICVGLIILTTAFSIIYFFYRCCCCCCCRGEKKKPVEKRFDSCQRIFFDILISVAIVVNLFAAVILLISTQYAQYSIEELPTRIHYCVNDLGVYKFENVERIRKLLRDDFQKLNTTLVSNFENIGSEIVEKFKVSTGADIIDILVDNVKKAKLLQIEFDNVKEQIQETQRLKQGLARSLYKLRDSESSLNKCASSALALQNTSQAALRQQVGGGVNLDAVTVKICQTVLKLIQPLTNNDEFDGDIIADDYISQILRSGNPEALNQIVELRLEERLSQSIVELNNLKGEIQSVVNSRQEDLTIRLHDLDNTMFRIYENVSSGIRNIDLQVVENFVDPMMQNREQFKTYVQYSWIISLIITGIFMFIAFAFLLGLFYGCCGRKPSLYNDDCCVRTTGSKFYSCGIWLSLAFMTFFAVITAAFIFVGANLSNLVCHPLEDPLARPDMLSLFDRFIEANGLDDYNQLQRYGLPQMFNTERRPVDIVRGCQNGATFYTMFGLDRKFKLLEIGGPTDEYEELASIIKALGIGRTYVPQNMHFYNEELRQSLDRLSHIHIEPIPESVIQKFRSMKENYEIDIVLHQLKKIMASEKSIESSPVASDVNRIIHYLEELKPNAQNVLTKIDSTANSLTHLRLAHISIAQLENNSSLTTNLSDRLQRIDAVLNSPEANAKLDVAAGEVVDEMGAIIKQYANHVNNTMRTEISSCEPIKAITRNTRMAICDYTLDHLNSVWMAMAISLLFMIPIIILSTRLTGLYARIDPLHTYLQDYTETNFATDTYYGNQNYNNDSSVTRMIKPNNNYNGHHTDHALLNGYSNSTLYNNGNSNYGYQEYYPPAYRHGRNSNS